MLFVQKQHGALLDSSTAHSIASLRWEYQRMNMNGNVLIHGATMVLPNETGVGDLRIRNGVIESCLLYTSDADDDP